MLSVIDYMYADDACPAISLAGKTVASIVRTDNDKFMLYLVAAICESIVLP